MRRHCFWLFCCWLLLASGHLTQAQNTPAPIKRLEFVLTPGMDDWTYPVGKRAAVQVTVLKDGVPLKDVSISYEVGPEMLPADQKGTLLLKRGTAKIDVGTSRAPGFRQLLVKAKYLGNTYSGQVKVGFSPERIQPTAALPADFRAFWAQAKAEAARVPMDAQLTYLPAYSTAAVGVYLLSLQHYRTGQRLYGYLCKPKAPGKYPVLLQPPGAGVKPMIPYTAYAEQGYISLSIEIHGYSPLLSDQEYDALRKTVGVYQTQNLEDRDTYYYKRVYLGCVRALDYLCGLPEFDGKNVVVTGGSQGGGLAIVTAGLDERVTALAAFYPALCDLTGYQHGRAGGWPHLLAKHEVADDVQAAQIRTMGYYDVVNFAKQLTAPGFYSWGYNDNTCPPTSVYAAVNAVQAPKTIVITPIAGHWRFEETNQESLQWLKKQVAK